MPEPRTAPARAGTDGPYECPDCDQQWESKSALKWCCNPAALARYGGDDD